MTTVAIAPGAAFRLFTEQLDLWWRRGRRFRAGPDDRGLMAMEPGVGGRVFESWHDAGGVERVREIGRVQVWEPPRRLVFSWRGANFAPDESTEVEVRFVPTPSGHTEVSVEHRGWAGIRPEHPVRHGQPAAAFIRSMGLWWGDLLTALRLGAVGPLPGASPGSRSSRASSAPPLPASPSPPVPASSAPPVPPSSPTSPR